MLHGILNVIEKNQRLLTIYIGDTEKEKKTNELEHGKRKSLRKKEEDMRTQKKKRNQQKKLPPVGKSRSDWSNKNPSEKENCHFQGNQYGGSDTDAFQHVGSLSSKGPITKEYTLPYLCDREKTARIVIKGVLEYITEEEIRQENKITPTKFSRMMTTKKDTIRIILMAMVIVKVEKLQRTSRFTNCRLALQRKDRDTTVEELNQPML